MDEDWDPLRWTLPNTKLSSAGRKVRLVNRVLARAAFCDLLEQAWMCQANVLAGKRRTLTCSRSRPSRLVYAGEAGLLRATIYWCGNNEFRKRDQLDNGEVKLKLCTAKYEGLFDFGENLG